jgi:WD40 repeat protein
MKRDFSYYFWKLVLVYLALSAFAAARAHGQETVIWEKTDAEPYKHVAFSHGGSMLAVGYASGNTSQILSTADGSLIRTLGGQHNGTNAMVFSPDDQYLITGVGQGGSTLTITKWRVEDATRLFLLGDHNNGDHSVSLSPDGQYVATSGHFGREVNIWRIADMARVLSIPNNTPGLDGVNARVKDVVYSPNGQFIATGDGYGLKVRSVSDGSIVFFTPSAEITSVDWSPDGQLIAAAVADEKAIKLFRAYDGSLVRTFTVDATEFDFPTIKFTPNGRLITAGYNTGWDAGALEFWRVSNGRVAYLDYKTGAVISLAFGRKGATMAYTQFDGRIAMINTPVMW